MEQFSLEKYLENPSRKITTRYGDRKVRIICTDRKDKRPIVALMVDMDDGSEYITSHSINGWIDDEEKYPDKRDLFFADEEERLSEFEKDLQIIISEASHWISDDGSISTYCQFGDKEIKRISVQILDLARKEILKDLPKWKKATEHEDLEKHIAILEDDKVLLSNYLEEGDYYIDLEDLKNLPKEE